MISARPTGRARGRAAERARSCRKMFCAQTFAVGARRVPPQRGGCPSSSKASARPYSVRYGSTASNERQRGAKVSASPPVPITIGTSSFGHSRLDAAHDPVDRLGRAEHDPRADALLRARADHAARRDQLRRGKLGRAPEERLGGAAHPGRDHAAEEHAVLRDAVEGRRRAEVDDDRVARVEPARRERVDDAVGADGERLVDLRA